MIKGKLSLVTGALLFSQVVLAGDPLAQVLTAFDTSTAQDKAKVASLNDYQGRVDALTTFEDSMKNIQASTDAAVTSSLSASGDFQLTASQFDMGLLKSPYGNNDAENQLIVEKWKSLPGNADKEPPTFFGGADYQKLARDIARYEATQASTTIENKYNTMVQTAKGAEDAVKALMDAETDPALKAELKTRYERLQLQRKTIEGQRDTSVRSVQKACSGLLATDCDDKLQAAYSELNTNLGAARTSLNQTSTELQNAAVSASNRLQVSQDDLCKAYGYAEGCTLTAEQKKEAKDKMQQAIAVQMAASLSSLINQGRAKDAVMDAKTAFMNLDKLAAAAQVSSEEMANMLAKDSNFMKGFEQTPMGVFVNAKIAKAISDKNICDVVNKSCNQGVGESLSQFDSIIDSIYNPNIDQTSADEAEYNEEVKGF